MNNRIRIAIDGPAAAGKSTVAKKIAEILSIVYVDTGAMYRALTLKAIKEDIDMDDELSLVEILKNTDITLQQSKDIQIVLLDNEDVSLEIRTNEVSNKVSYIAQHHQIRTEMIYRQQKLADNVSVVMDGRDIGTRVLPDAEVKIFLIASVHERAIRRHEENIRKGFSSDLNELEKEIKERDERDINRKSSPLVKADDAISIDTTSLSIQEVVDKILHYILEYQNNEG